MVRSNNDIVITEKWQCLERVHGKREEYMLKKKTNSRSIIWKYFGLKLTIRKIYKTKHFAEHVDEAF